MQQTRTTFMKLVLLALVLFFVDKKPSLNRKPFHCHRRHRSSDTIIASFAYAKPVPQNTNTMNGLANVLNAKLTNIITQKGMNNTKTTSPTSEDSSGTTEDSYTQYLRDEFNEKYSLQAKYGQYKSTQATNAFFQCVKSAFDRGGQDVTEVSDLGAATTLANAEHMSSSDASSVGDNAPCNIAGIQSLFDEDYIAPSNPASMRYSARMFGHGLASPEVSIPYYNFANWWLFRLKMLDTLYSGLKLLSSGMFGSVYSGKLLYNRFETHVSSVSRSVSNSAVSLDDLLSELSSPTAHGFDEEEKEYMLRYAKSKNLAAFKRGMYVAVKIQPIGTLVNKISAAYQELKAYALLERLHEESVTPFFVQPVGAYFFGISNKVKNDGSFENAMDPRNLYSSSFDDATPLETVLDTPTSIQSGSVSYSRYMAFETELLGSSLNAFLKYSISKYRQNNPEGSSPKMPSVFFFEMIIGEYSALHFSFINVYDRHTNNFNIVPTKENSFHIYSFTSSSSQTCARVSAKPLTVKRIDVGLFESCIITPANRTGYVYNSCQIWHSHEAKDFAEPIKMPVQKLGYFSNSDILNKVAEANQALQEQVHDQYFKFNEGPAVDRTQFRREFRKVLKKHGIEDTSAGSDAKIAAAISKAGDFKNDLHKLAKTFLARDSCPDPRLKTYGSPWFEIACRFCTDDGEFGDLCLVQVKWALIELLWGRPLQSVISRYFSMYLIDCADPKYDYNAENTKLYTVPVSA